MNLNLQEYILHANSLNVYFAKFMKLPLDDHKNNFYAGLFISSFYYLFNSCLISSFVCVYEYTAQTDKNSMRIKDINNSFLKRITFFVPI